jgi:very-short-patch-repair endonuclease
MIHDKKPLSRALRKRSTFTEKIAWNMLRNRRCLGLKFRRQYVFLGFVLDFYCLELRLALEIDGNSHLGREDYDDARQSSIENEGVSFIRIKAEDLLESPERLIRRVRDFIADKTPSPAVVTQCEGGGTELRRQNPHPHPLSQRERGA